MSIEITTILQVCGILLGSAWVGHTVAENRSLRNKIQALQTINRRLVKSRADEQYNSKK